MIVRAVDLRIKSILTKIPNDKPGYYKWWAKKRIIRIIVNKTRRII